MIVDFSKFSYLSVHLNVSEINKLFIKKNSYLNVKLRCYFFFEKYSDLIELTKFIHSKYFLNNSYAFLFFFIMKITTIIICVQNLSVRKYNNVKTIN